MSKDVGMAEAISSIRKQLIEAQRAGAGSDLQFEVSEVRVELAVVLERTGGGSVGVNVWAVTADIEGKRARTGTHRVGVTMRPVQTGGNATARIGSDQAVDPYAS